MLPKLFLSLILILNINISAISQYTEEFNKIDAKHGFKDAAFGTSYEVLKNKMKLESNEASPPNGYFIRNKKFLSIGYFNCVDGIAGFTKNKYSNISLYITVEVTMPFESILAYFTDLFGSPTKSGEHYYWWGKKVSFSLRHIITENLNEALLSIASQIIKSDKGADNF